MTLSKLIEIAARAGYLFDEVAYSKTKALTFIGTFDGHSASRVTFDSVSEAAKFFYGEADR